MESINVQTAAAADPSFAAAQRYSRYVRRLVAAEPHLAVDADCTHPFDSADMAALLAALPADDEAALIRSLRVLRRRVMLHMIARDVGGACNLAEVLKTATALAQTAISAAVGWLDDRLAQQHGRPRGAATGAVQQLHVIGMGKLGGGELNVSSDVDLVFVYPEDGETDGTQPLSNHEYFTRLARQLIAR
jgi:[glutamine synthetase] adenylyltransferase / [glutamine synthetase]-adenylyl-L-tyrosine phosphorylase